MYLKLFSFMILLMIIDVSFGQTNNTISNAKVYDNPPQFPGGQDSLLNYLKNNIVYPYLEWSNGIQGLVTATFTIDKSGKIKDLRISKGLTPRINDEAIRVLSQMPDWIPALLNENPINAEIDLKIKFSINIGYRLQMESEFKQAEKEWKKSHNKKH
ncbi:energy transducer TonB [Bacteroidota bacterium]